MKKILIFLSIIALGFGLLMSPLALKNQNFLHHQMDKVLKLKIRDTFSGGKKMFRFSDPMGDDNGGGDLLYPRNKIYKENGTGLLDLLSFIIHKPVTREDWSNDFIYWQFSYKFKNLVPSKNSHFIHPVITHYFSFLDEGNEVINGSTETINPRGELVTFNPNYPWQFVIQINGRSETAKITSYDKSYTQDITVIVNNKSNTIMVRVPLKYKPLRDVFKEKDSFHYILVGAYDELATTGFMAVKKRPGLGNGGGATSSLTPKIYDYLSPGNTTQRKLLTSYDDYSFKYAVLDPVIASYKNIPLDENSITPEMLKETEALSELESKNKKIDVLAKLNGEFDSYLDHGIAYFNAGEMDKAEALFKNVLDSNKNDSKSLAYLGSIEALKGGAVSSKTKAIKFVYKAFDLFDEALLNSKTLDEELTVRLNRGNVSLSVPESVFFKREEGSKDFIRASEIYQEIYPDKIKSIAHCYVMASLCLKEIGRNEDAQIYFNQASKLSQIYESDKLILLQNNILVDF